MIIPAGPDHGFAMNPVSEVTVDTTRELERIR